MTVRLDLTGDRYGRLTVISEADRVEGNNDRWWHCQCDCGNRKIVRMNQLRIGRTKSCGCLKKERTSAANIKDLTGRTFGKLTVIVRSEKLDTKKRVFWSCKCECGKIVDVPTTNLLSGTSKSCGCRRVEIGHRVQGFIEKYYRKDNVRTTALRRKRGKNNTTGIKGVSEYKTKSGIKYRVFIGIKNKNLYLGSYETLEEAATVRKNAEEEYHKPYLDI